MVLRDTPPASRDGLHHDSAGRGAGADARPTRHRTSSASLPDAAQSGAGLGRRTPTASLGWRTAAVVADDLPFGWEQAAGFVAEFCALGGRIVDRSGCRAEVDPAASFRDSRHVDGVFLAARARRCWFVEALRGATSDLSRAAGRHGGAPLRPERPARLTPRCWWWPRASPLEPTGGHVNSYAAAFAKAFPAIPRRAPRRPLAIRYRDGVEPPCSKRSSERRGDGRR